jgi:hypothetical protein
MLLQLHGVLQQPGVQSVHSTGDPLTPYSVLLLCDREMVQTVRLDLGSLLTSACCTAPTLQCWLGWLARLLYSHCTMAIEKLSLLKTRIGELPGSA